VREVLVRVYVGTVLFCVLLGLGGVVFSKSLARFAVSMWESAIERNGWSGPAPDVRAFRALYVISGLLFLFWGLFNAFLRFG
jgi:hypothetical protein